MRILILLCCAPLWAAAFEDGDCELPELGPWRVYGTPVAVEKVLQPHSGRRALRVVTDNQDTMSGYEGVSHALGELQPGDRVRLRVWLRPLAGRPVVIGIGRTSFEGFWTFVDSDWFEAICDFRATAAGPHNVWIAQQNAPNEFLIDDATLDTVPRVTLGTVPGERRVALTSRLARVWFDRETGALCGIENLATQETPAPLGIAQPTFAIDRLADDGRSFETIGFDRARRRATRRNGDSIAFEYVLDDLTVACRWRLVGTELTGRIDVQNDGARPVMGVTFPLLQGVCPANDPGRLVLVDPYLCGRITPNAIASRGCDTTFPGRGVMGWLDLSGERGGISLACHDREWTGTRIAALPAGPSAFDLSLTPEVVIAGGERWTSPEMVVGIHEGDWHWAADRYREWLTSWQPPPDVPTWLRGCNGWVLVGCQNQIPFRRLAYWYKQAQWMGIDYLHVQGQHIDGLWYGPDGKRATGAFTLPIPNPLLGGEEGLRNAVRAVHAGGGHIMFYFLYERWAPSLSTSEQLGGGGRADVADRYRLPDLDFYRANALLERPGGQLPADHPPMVQRTMCLASSGWQDWMTYWGVEVYARRFGADGMYWDVMGRNGPFRCFNAASGHNGDNDWAKGCVAVMQRILSAGRRENPDYSAAIEGCSAALRPWVGFHLMSGATQQPEVFRYTLPDVLLVDGFSNHIWKWTQPEKARRVFLAGERFDLHGYDARVKPLVQLRERLRAYTDWPARFMDTVGVRASSPEVQARRFVRADGGNRLVALTLLNEKRLRDATIEVDIAPLEQVHEAYLFGLDGRIEATTTAPAGEGRRRIAVPPDEVSGVLLVERAESDAAVTLTASQVMAPGEDGVEVTLFAPLGDAPSGPVTAVDARGVAWTRVSEERPIAAVRRVRFAPPEPVPALPDWLKVTVESAGRRAWCVVAPPLVNGDMEATEDGHLVHWGVAPDETEKASGRASLRVDNDGHSVGHVSALAALKPNTRYRFSGAIRRHTVGSHVSAAVIEYEEGSAFRLSAELGANGAQDQWERFETEFTSHPAPRTSAVYLYNRGGRGSAWFDDLRLEELR